MIPLRNRAKDIIAYTAVDQEDFERFGHLSWSLQGWRNVYAGRMKNKTIVLLHREILGLEFGDPNQGDHKNGNKFDNRKSNLRIVTNAQNRQNRDGLDKNNTSGYRGVYWEKKKRKWKAQYTLNNLHYHVGYFDNPRDANMAIKTARSKALPYSEMDQ